jgi:hypothetical protein
MKAFNAKEFRAKIAGLGGPAQTNHFELQIVPQGATNLLRDSEIGDDIEQMSFRIHMADMPSRTLETMDRRYAGPFRNVPVGHTYTTLQIQLLEYGDRKSRKIFDVWQELIMDNQNGWNVPYYKDLVADMYLRVYNKFDESGSSAKTEGYTTPAAIYKFYDAFPVSIANSQLSWDNRNQVLIIPIELAYHRWESVKLEPYKYMMPGKSKTKTLTSKSFIDRLKEAKQTYDNVVTGINTVKQTYNNIKTTVADARAFVKQVKKFKLDTSSIDSIGTSVSNLGKIFDSGISAADRASRRFDQTVDSSRKIVPIFTSSKVNTPLPAPVFDVTQVPATQDQIVPVFTSL